MSERFTDDKLLGLVMSVLEEGKATDITALDTARQSGGLFAHIVVATATSSRHTLALTRRLARALKDAGHSRMVEESSEREWSLVDAGSVVAHVMQPEARERYNLEGLWGFERDVEGDVEQE